MIFTFLNLDFKEAIVVSKTIDGKKYTWDVPEGTVVNGYDEIFVNKQKFPVMYAIVLTKYCMFDVENPRLEDARGNKPDTQRAIEEFLKSGSLTEDYEKLIDSMDHAGGQNELMLGQCVNGKVVAKEGNRRLAGGRSKKWPTLKFILYPDQMSKEDILDRIVQRHIAGITGWSSVAKSKIAYDYLTQRKMPIDEIVKLLGFSSKNDAMKYIFSYATYAESGITNKEDWSKFWHAMTPSLKSLFGLNSEFHLNGNSVISDDFRKSVCGMKPEEIDQRAGECAVRAGYIKKSELPDFKLNFPTFVDLIEKGHISNCLHSGSLNAFVRKLDDPFADKAMEILFSKPKKGENSPGEQAKNYWDVNRHKSSLADHCVKTKIEVDTALKSVKELKKIKGNTVVLLNTQSSAVNLICSLKKLLAEIDESGETLKAAML